MGIYCSICCSEYCYISLDDGEYKGKLSKDYKPNGSGEMIYKNGDIYIGNWDNNQRFGNGLLVKRNGTQFIGEWKENKLTGRGKIVHNENIFDLYFRENKVVKIYSFVYMYTMGKYKFDGTISTITKKNDNRNCRVPNITINDIDNEIYYIVINSYGTMCFPNGDIYEGYWNNNMMNNFGKIIYLNGDKYIGNFNNDLKHGYGEYEYINGNKYEGKWENDKKNGNGKMVYANGDIYEGQWKNDKKENKGTLKYFNGNTYEGDFANNDFNGNGTMTILNNYIYNGEFKDGKFDGNGVSTFVNGDKYNGKFSNNKYNGMGKIIYEDGTEVEGYFVDDILKDGEGVYKKSPNEVFTGKIKNYKYCGNGILNFGNQTIVGDFNNDKIYGIVSDENSRYFGNLIFMKKHGYGNIIYNNEPDNIINGIWYHGENIITCRLNKNEKYCCEICLNDDYDAKLLFPLCNNPTCQKIGCITCIKKYYDRIKRGCFMNDFMFECIFCKNEIDKRMLKFVISNLFEYIPDHRFDEIRKSKKIYGWCEYCNDIHLITDKTIQFDYVGKKYICNNCNIENLQNHI
jgi:hypothetical protein